MPLISGHYSKTGPLWSFTGGLANVSQPNLACRSNLKWDLLGNPTDGALAASGVASCVSVPVEIGDIVTRVSLPIGATAAGTPTNQFVALYSGVATPALLGQSVDTLTAAIAASATSTWTLATPVLITTANAPNGFIYVAVSITATTVPTAVTCSVPTAIGYKWFPNSPLFLSATAGSALAGTAAATIVTPVAKAVTPIVFLT